MRPKKTRLQLGRRCRKTTLERKKVMDTATSWIKTEDEIFNNTCFKDCFVPQTPVVRKSNTTEQTTPPTPKRRTTKRKTSAHSGKITPSNSPSAKNVRCSLFDTQSGYMLNESIRAPSDTGNNDVNLKTDIDELIYLIPDVMKKLSEEGHHKSMLMFFRLVNSSQFPLKNIAFQLLMEVVAWFQCDNTTEMRYSESTKKFWKLGYRLFGGQFLYFMSGYKNRNTVITEKTEKGVYPPSQSEINFAVPGKDILTSFSPYHVDERHDKSVVGRCPGILTDMIDSLASSHVNKSFCITFDGKKLKRGLTKSSGDVDLLGFEPDLTMAQRLKQLDDWKEPVDQMMNEYSDRDELENIGTDLPESERMNIAEMLTCQMKTVSLNLLNARELRKKKQYAKDKLVERSGGSDWKNGKFVVGISAQIAFIHDIDEYVRETVNLLDEIIKCICCLKHSNKVIDQNEMNLDESDEYTSIDGFKAESNRQIKQRSKEWFHHRSTAKVTGSTIYAALGLDGLARQKEHFDVVIGQLDEKQKAENVQTIMAYGTHNEINAVATLVGKVIPMVCPGEKAFEEGLVKLNSNDNTSFMIVSPDGSVRSSDREESTTMAIELKCPIYDVQKSVPERYLLQCLSEIEALNVESCLYLCWRPDISNVFKIKRTTPLFQNAFSLAESIYNIEKPKRPTKLCEESKTLKEEICLACKSSSTVEFIGTVPSLKHNSNVINKYDNCRFLIRRFGLLLNQLNRSYETFYKLQRQPATEAVVFLCYDLDRKWEKDKAHSAPVCWFPKGASMDTATMRNIFESVIDECKRAGLHVPASSFDGQWHNIAVRDTNNSPLTILQLQKDVWKRVERMTKREQLKKIADMNKFVKTIQIKSLNDGLVSLVCTNGGLVLPKLSSSVSNKRKESKCDSTNENSGGVTNENEVDDTQDTINRELTAENEDDTNLDVISGPDVESVTAQENKREFNENDLMSILTQLRLDKQANAKSKWEDTVSQDIAKYFQTGQTLRKLRDVELRIVVRYINRTFNMTLKESARKETKINHLCTILKLNNNSDHVHESITLRKTQQPKRLSEIALRKVSTTLRKSDLNIIYAEYVWPQEYKQWKENKCDTFTKNPEEVQFYFPSYSVSRQQLEVSSIDSSHLLTRMRRKSAKGGLGGLSNEAWRKVAKSKKTALSLGMVDCILEPMTVSVANTHFSEAVENEMRLNGNVKEADLCNDIRMWWRAEDEPGITAEQRMQLRNALRLRLMSYIDFAVFPPPGMYVHGWPTQLWEGIVASIDAKKILYNITANHAYNVRAFSSMMGETFFSELTLYDRRGQGTVTCQEFGQYIDTAIEKLHMRMDPNRSFSYTTSRKKVYNIVRQYQSTTPPMTDDYDGE